MYGKFAVTGMVLIPPESKPILKALHPVRKVWVVTAADLPVPERFRVQVINPTLMVEADDFYTENVTVKIYPGEYPGNNFRNQSDVSEIKNNYFASFVLLREMNMSFAEKIISFNKSLRFDQPLPEGIRVMNPYAENPDAMEASSQFYRKYYNDNLPRKLILGINPGRFGAGVTGIPFTDTKRLKEMCGIEIRNVSTHETSSVFVYDFITAYGGTEAFYREYYISAVCPLGFVQTGKNGREVNLNYYDFPGLITISRQFIIKSLELQLDFGIDRECCFCFGNNKNFKYLTDLNREKQYFRKVVPLEHPRFIMQYRSKHKDLYIHKYLQVLNNENLS